MTIRRNTHSVSFYSRIIMATQRGVKKGMGDGHTDTHRTTSGVGRWSRHKHLMGYCRLRVSYLILTPFCEEILRVRGALRGRLSKALGTGRTRNRNISCILGNFVLTFC